MITLLPDSATHHFFLIAPLDTILWCTFALACGGLIKGTLGVGTPLLTVPLMALVLPAQTAVTLMAMPVVVANLWQAARAPNIKSIVGRFWPVVVAIICGTIIGTRILSVINERLLLFVVGLCVIVFTLFQTSSFKLQLESRWVLPAGIVFGIASGVIGGISSMFGPMLIIYLVSVKDLGKDDFVSTISFLYVCAVVPWAVLLFSVGLLKGTLLLGSLAAVIPVTAGMVVGQHLRKYISEDRFQHLMLLVLLASGGSMLWRAYSVT